MLEQLRAAPSLLMHHFSLSTNDVKINTTSVKYVTGFQRFCGLSDFLSRCMCSQYEFVVVYGQTTTSAFHNIV